jgi:hypothetical protein
MKKLQTLCVVALLGFFGAFITWSNTTPSNMANASVASLEVIPIQKIINPQRGDINPLSIDINTTNGNIAVNGASNRSVSVSITRSANPLVLIKYKTKVIRRIEYLPPVVLDWEDIKDIGIEKSNPVKVNHSADTTRLCLNAIKTSH